MFAVTIFAISSDYYSILVGQSIHFLCFLLLLVFGFILDVDIN